MPGPLRPIAVLVSEPAAGRFVWELIESEAGDEAGEAEWTRLLVSKARFTSYADALAAGLEALQAQMDDPAIGPRAEEGVEAATPPIRHKASKAPSTRAPPAKAAPARKKAFFGFGPVK
ncbi:MAG: hypothetical protein EOO24_02180 [Comamonadaceae bacterium]|nr:MAG: hypothetical protein EOO24_02180 [Comamonadaceae bacterium]